MEDKHKIEKMKKEGTITPEQPELLFHALNESERRRQAVLEDIKVQKKSRKNKVKGFLGWGLFVALVLISILLHLALARSPGRDVQKALKELGQAGSFVEKQNYPQAVESIEKGIEKAPRFFLAVRNFNAKIETFPGVFLAPMFGYEEKVFFEAKKEAAEPVKAKF